MSIQTLNEILDIQCLRQFLHINKKCYLSSTIIEELVNKDMLPAESFSRPPPSVVYQRSQSENMTPNKMSSSDSTFALPPKC